LGIKAKKVKPKDEKPSAPTSGSEDQLPTIYQLASLATKLIPNRPEAFNNISIYLPESVKAASELWNWARAQVSTLRETEEGQKYLSQLRKQVLEKAKRPKRFPVSMDKMIRGLIPNRSVDDRERICRDFLRSVLPTRSLEELSPQRLEANVEAMMAERFNDTLQEGNWEHLVFMFQMFLPEYQKELRTKKAMKAAQSRPSKKD